MAIYSIYRFTNLVNGKVYIGKTVQEPIQRKAEHIRACNNNSQTLLHRALCKYGIENFDFQVIFNTFDTTTLDEYERQFIKEYDCCFLDDQHKGYNMTRGGEGIGSELCSKLQQARVADRTHNWLREHNLENVRRHNTNMLAEGRHPFAGEAGSKLAIARNLKHGNKFAGEEGANLQKLLITEGRHQSQHEHVCPHCGKRGKGSGMYNWHFDRCRRREVR